VLAVKQTIRKFEELIKLMLLLTDDDTRMITITPSSYNNDVNVKQSRFLTWLK